MLILINNQENKKENLRLQVLLGISFFARTLYKAETVTSGFCYIEDLIFLENNIVSF